MAYALLGQRWATPGNGAPVTITWSFATSNYAGQVFNFDTQISANFQTEVRRAFAQWEHEARIDFVEVADSANSGIRLGMDIIDGSGGILGQEYHNPAATFITRAEIGFDQAEQWSPVGFYSVALHEIGHALGLAHYDSNQELMNSVVPLSGTIFPGDREGMQVLYGSWDNVPGNRTSAVTIATNGAPVLSSIEPGADDDFYRVNLVAGRTYTIEVVGTNGRLLALPNPGLDLWDGTSASPLGYTVVTSYGQPYQPVPGYSNVEAGNRETITYLAPTTGVYWIEVSNDSVSVSADGSYSLRVTSTPGLVYTPQTLALAAFGSSAGGWVNNETYRRDAADINGDGLADIIGFGADGTFVSLAQNAGGYGAMYLANNSFGAGVNGGGWHSNDRYHRDLADMNGDGRADVVGFGAAGTYVALGTAAGGFAPMSLVTNTFGTDAAAGGWASQNTYTRQLGDVNGDGRADIVGFGSAGAYISLAQAGGGFAPQILATDSFGATAQAGGWSSDTLYHRELADVNGDGKADIVGFGSAGTYVALATSDGDFAAAMLAINSFGRQDSAGGWVSQDMYPRHLADVNGDGRADIVGFGSDHIFIALGQGNGTFAGQTSVDVGFGRSSQAGGWASDNLYPRMLADIDGDRDADIIGFASGGVMVSQFDLV